MGAKMYYLILDTSDPTYNDKLASIANVYDADTALNPRLNINPSGTKALVTVSFKEEAGLEWIDAEHPIILASGDMGWAKNLMWDGYIPASGNEWELPEPS